MGGERKREDPGLSRGLLIDVDFENYFRDSGSEVFFGDFWFR
jgi:hypothetical protein